MIQPIIAILGDFFPLPPQTDRGLYIHLDPDKAETYLNELPKADIVIVNVAPAQLADSLATINPVLKQDAILVDIYPLKQSSQAMILGRLPDWISYIGMSYPSAEHLILTPAPNTDLKAMEVLSALWQDVFARIEILPVESHDEVMFTTCLLPPLLQGAVQRFIRQDLEGDTRVIVENMVAASYANALNHAWLAPDFLIFERDKINTCLETYLGDLIALRKSIRRGDRAYLETILSSDDDKN